MQPRSLTISNGSRHADVVKKVVSAIEKLQVAGERISFYSVAEKAHVSRSTLYRSDDLKSLVAAARASAPAHSRDLANLDNRVAELERELARVSQERDELMRAARHAPSIQYAYMRVSEAA